MSARVHFTEAEQNELRLAMKSGGIFLKIYSDSNFNVEVEAADGNGRWKTIQSFDRDISEKICALYDSQSDYRAPLVAGFRKVSISWFIGTYC